MHDSVLNAPFHFLFARERRESRERATQKHLASRVVQTSVTLVLSVYNTFCNTTVEASLIYQKLNAA